jgi:hypothetical protein
LRRNRPGGTGPGQPAERRQAARDQDHPRRRPRPLRRDRACEPGCRDRRQRHHGDDDTRGQRLEPPAVDQQDHEQEERGDEGARDEHQRDVGGHVRPLDGPEVGRRTKAALAEQRGEDQRGLDDEDRLPAEELREDSADCRSAGGSENPGDRPYARGPRLSSDRGGQEQERGAHDGGPGDALDGSPGDQHAE